MTTDVGIHLKAFNWHLWDARRAKGLSQVQLAEDTGLPTWRIQQFEGLRRWPTESEAGELAAVLEVEEDVLFPEALQLRSANVASSVRFRIPLSALPAPEEPDMLSAPFHDELRTILLSMLDGLTRRDAKIVRLRFGLDDGRSRTLEEIAREFGVIRERIRQIEAKALRKLRHPTYSKRLKTYLAEM